LKIFDHSQGLLYIGNFLLKTLPALRQIIVHIAILPILHNISDRNERNVKQGVRKGILKVSKRGIDLNVWTAEMCFDVCLDSDDDQ
jgi:hypothetical protein